MMEDEMDVDDPVIGDIDEKYRIPLTGDRNNSIMWCPNCDYEMPNTIEDIIGFSEYQGEVVKILECPKCFTKHWHHMRELDEYRRFQRFIVNNRQKHFKSI